MILCVRCVSEIECTAHQIGARRPPPDIETEIKGSAKPLGFGRQSDGICGGGTHGANDVPTSSKPNPGAACQVPTKASSRPRRPSQDTCARRRRPAEDAARPEVFREVRGSAEPGRAARAKQDG